MAGLLEHALAYAARGWSIIPVAGKKPAGIRWKRYQTKRPSDKTLRRWFGKDTVTGLAVICGPVSGGLVVRDFDTVDAYARWSRDFPELAEILPTAQTGRGFHVYFTGDRDDIVHIDVDGVHEGELRGSGYVVLPPSLHPGGLAYRWTVRLPEGPIPAVDAVAAGLLPADLDGHLLPNEPVQQREQRTQRLQKRTENTEDMVGDTCGTEENNRIDEIIESTLPEAERKRYKAVFELARALKAEPTFADADPSDLESIVRRWHQRALPVIGTKPFEETWIDFLKGWPKVKFPRGAGPMDIVFEQARAVEPPAVAMRYEQAGLRQLVALCRALQTHAGASPFFLACRTAGRVLGVDYSTACRWLFLLRSDGVLKETEKGGKSGGRFRATRYIYEGDEVEASQTGDNT